MNLKLIALISFCLLIIQISLGNKINKTITPGNYVSHQVTGNKVVFVCQNKVQVQLEQISPEIFKIWYDTNNFIQNNPSFAVIKQADTAIALNLSTQLDGFEIYTSSLIVRVQKSPFKINIFDKWQKLLMEDYQGQGFVVDSQYISSYKTLKPEERIYGLGEKNGSINRVGDHFKMWNSDKPCYQIIEDPLYKSIPFFMSSSGYGIFFDNTYKTIFNFDSPKKDFYSFSAPGGELVYYFMYGPTLKKLIYQYTGLTGKPIMPPAWAMGFAQCRGMLTNEKLTREIATGYRERYIPCDIIYQDIGWTQYLQDFEWRDENYENPKKMLSDLDAVGFKVIVSQDPVISQANSIQWHQADSLGYFTKDTRTGKTYNMPWPWGGNCGIVDFTNQSVSDWWGNYQQKVIDDGVRGFWTDMGEPAWSNEENTDRLTMKHQLGMHNEIHNVYGLTWDKVVTEQFEKNNSNVRVFQMTRSGFAGMQRYAFGWSGDTGNGNEVTQGWGQLAAQIPVAISAGLGLIPFWSCDISGYCGDITDYEDISELYIRWVQFGAFNPLSRIHHEGNNAVEPWLFGAEAEQICKSAIELKYQLFPYIYSYAREAYDEGLPIIRPLVMEYPDDETTFNLSNEFLFGEELLVAPVVEEGAITRKIYLPEGEWIDFNQKLISYEGNQWIDFPVTLEQIPIFVRKGSIIPQMPVMQFINQNPDYSLILDIFPASTNKKAQFDIYEDDGETNNYKKDVFVKRQITCKTNLTDYEINYRVAVENNFNEIPRIVIYKIHLKNKPIDITLEDQKIKPSKVVNLRKWMEEPINKLDWNWDIKTRICYIRAPSTSKNHTIKIKK
ncbi:MAG: glycoside hydrolase family 31 protein [Salinivirgaceae bacterium]|nr:glycoside hydrolase family 31 protein [Salinivirgaceae bacterium]